jgi:hypothetical protein
MQPEGADFAAFRSVIAIIGDSTRLKWFALKLMAAQKAFFFRRSSKPMSRYWRLLKRCQWWLFCRSGFVVTAEPGGEVQVARADGMPSRPATWRRQQMQSPHDAHAHHLATSPRPAMVRERALAYITRAGLNGVA